MNSNGVMHSHDSDIVQVYRALEPYVCAHPLAEIGVFRRQGIDTLSVRIIDPDFEGVRWKPRNERVWTILDAAPAEIVDRIAILLLMTPREAAESHVSSVEFDDPSEGPVRFVGDMHVFRKNIAGQDVFVTVGQYHLADASQSNCFGASFKFGFPPGIIDAADYGLSIDAGGLVLDANYAPRWFESAEAANFAGVEVAKERLARLAAA